MFRSRHQKGCFSVFYSLGSSPLQFWSTHIQNGYIKRVIDEDVKSVVMEIMGSNVSTTYITGPRDPKMSFGIKLPFLVLLIKNLHKYFTFEVKILDDQRFMRRFRVSNFQSKTSVKPFCTAMPMGMSPGWNQIHFNLADFTRRAYGTNYLETVRLQIHANVRIRRIYFTDHLYSEEDLPNEFRLVSKPAEKNKGREYKVPPAARPPSPAKSPTTTERAVSPTGETTAAEPSEPPTEGVDTEKYY
ncbi:cilia- and flagella-associated protein 20 [Anastrepha ludens]|uniref:cilia- and flagella-associated protein 20 n=1 Tax=Anastrepha ludens TaxID=28586 RepID=UPI0023B1FFA7|nr:cilia- and flagella-associated protein 20 [Anastrepha ludens]XP_053959648.1 cilia- and flagella-associated protein 20 [Anastrepha ludens]